MNLAGEFGWMTGLILEEWKGIHGESQTIPANVPNNTQAPHYFRGKWLVRLSLSTIIGWIYGWVLKLTYTTDYTE